MSASSIHLDGVPVGGLKFASVLVLVSAALGSVAYVRDADNRSAMALMEQARECREVGGHPSLSEAARQKCREIVEADRQNVLLSSKRHWEQVSGRIVDFDVVR